MATLETLSTPAVVIDRSRMLANIRQMQATCDAHGIELRPHIKTHKMTAIAREQLATGARGLTCAKLGEAEVMLPSGARELFVAHSREEAIRLCRPYLTKKYEVYHAWGQDKAMPEGEDSILSDAAWREKLARMDIEISGLEMFEMDFYSKLASGQNPGPLSSMIKLRGTEVMQQVQEYAVEAASWYSIPFPEQRTWNSNVEPIGPEGVDVLAPRYFNGRKMTIYGGSSEVQRGIMSKVMLGL